MKSYVLNLERAIERREYAKNQFKYYGIDFEFLYGVDWRDITNQDIFENVHPKYLSNANKWKRPLIHGGLACWLSHRKIWKTALKNEEKVIAVFEDDCRLTDNTKSALDSICQFTTVKGKSEFDIVFLYNGKLRNPILPVHKINDKFTLGVIKYDSIGAVGYVITSKAMKKLLDNFPQMVEVVDIVMHSYWLNGLKTYMISPQVVFHGEPNITHRSYSTEPYKSVYIGNIDKESLRHNKGKMFSQKTYILFTQGIPKRLAFHKRMRAERINRNSNNA